MSEKNIGTIKWLPRNTTQHEVYYCKLEVTLELFNWCMHIVFHLLNISALSHAATFNSWIHISLVQHQYQRDK